MATETGGQRAHVVKMIGEMGGPKPPEITQSAEAARAFWCEAAEFLFEKVEWLRGQVQYHIDDKCRMNMEKTADIVALQSRLGACRDAMLEALQEIPFGEGMRGVVVLREALKGPARVVEGQRPAMTGKDLHQVFKPLPENEASLLHDYGTEDYERIDRENPSCINDSLPCAPNGEGGCVACSDYSAPADEGQEP